MTVYGPKIDPLQVGSRIRRLRGSLSLAAFGMRVGVTAKAVQNYERGRLPRAEILHRIADRYGISLTWVLTGKGQETVTDRVAEQPESYRRVGKKERKLRKTFNELLESNDKEILDLLSKQIDLLAELMESRKRKKK